MFLDSRCGLRRGARHRRLHAHAPHTSPHHPHLVTLRSSMSDFHVSSSTTQGAFCWLPPPATPLPALPNTPRRRRLAIASSEGWPVSSSSATVLRGPRPVPEGSSSLNRLWYLQAGAHAKCGSTQAQPRGLHHLQQCDAEACVQARAGMYVTRWPLLGSHMMEAAAKGFAAVSG